MDEFLVNPLIKALVAAIVPFFIGWILQHSTKFSLIKEKNKLELLSSFLSWPIESRHHALVEETFKSYFGTRFKYTELIFVLGLQNPMHVFNLLRGCRKYLEFSEEKKYFELSESIESDKKFNRVLWSNLISYWFFAFMSLWPLMYSPKLIGNYGLTALITILVFSIFGLFFSISFLWESHKMKDAKKVIVQQSYIAKT